MIQERVRAGLARARSEGKRLGRPTIPAEKEAAIRAALAKLAALAYARLPLSLALILARCSGSADRALSRSPWPPAREEVNVQAAFLGVIAALFLVEGLTPIGMIDVSVAAVPLALALVFAAWAIHSTWTDGPRR